ncbi:uncharacterized protein LOC134837058 [Culicoides brevitarsis]|uniref:uncharacterized protein LOC134837058 n=1 Tax=Culicoides brevitarsis TaxID=469753 RepID=UPI00307C32F9
MDSSKMDCSTIEQQLYEKQQKGEFTDCAFVFKVQTEDGKFSKNIIHGHKLVLSGASKYFETNFKSEWNGNSVIEITSFDIKTFGMLMRAIYLNEVIFESVEEALNLYEAARFYQIERILDLLRQKIPKIYLINKLVALSALFEMAKQPPDSPDHILLAFATKYFIANTQKIIANDDFLQYPPDLVNSLFLHDDLSAEEINLVIALENYIEVNGVEKKSLLKPAIGALRFLSLPKDKIRETLLLTDSEKEFLLGQRNRDLCYLSKSRNGRKVRDFFTQLPARIQLELMDKLSRNKCWVCDKYHGVANCDKAQKKYPFYKKLIPLAYYAIQSPDNVVKILSEFQKASIMYSDFAAFANIGDVLNENYCIRWF